MGISDNAAMSKPVKKGKTKLVYVRWFDSSITDGGTCRLDDAAGILENESAGVLVKEDESSVTIALDRCIETQGLRCTLCIPRVNIRSVRRFKA
jgi:hypothetical protein